MRGRLGGLVVAVALACAAFGVSVAQGAPASKSTTFKIARSTGAALTGCLTKGAATATIVSSGSTETMTIDATGLPPHVAFDVFVIQVPNAPFGVSSYVGAIKSGNQGNATGQFTGRFGQGTFTIAPGVATAPQLHPGVDATSNPAFAPVHQLHLGLWFDSPDGATAAGCSATVTPFNGTHTAGIQAFSTRNFADGSGPLGRIH